MDRRNGSEARGRMARGAARRRKKRKSKRLGFLLVFSLLTFTAIGAFLSQEPKRQLARLERLERLRAEQSHQDRQIDSSYMNQDTKEGGNKEGSEFPEWIDVQLIEIDGAARRGERLEAVRDIVVHYVGNPETTAQQNRDYFNNPDSEVSAHFVVGIEGEVIQCVPLTEKSSASNDRNKDTISIEVCHVDETGEFSAEAYNALVKLTAWLCRATGLNEKHVIRHYDVTGKNCPLYFVEHPEAWSLFRKDVKQALKR